MINGGEIRDFKMGSTLKTTLKECFIIDDVIVDESNQVAKEK